MSNIKKNKIFQPIFGLSLQGRVGETIPLMKKLKKKSLSNTEKLFVTKFLKRFDERVAHRYRCRDLFIKELINIYQEYWFRELLSEKPSKSSIRCLYQTVSNFCRENGYSFKEVFDEKYFSNRLKKIIESRGLYCITGIVLPLHELEIWSKQKNKKYEISLVSGKETINTYLLSGFICKGWMDFATMGVVFPGGWAKREGLFCNTTAYNLNSEWFRISYLSHEAQHFADYKKFPKLEQIDLEYRAKLTELSRAKRTMKKLIRSFSMMSDYNKKSPHSFANHCVIRDISKKLLNKKLPDDLNDWKNVSTKKINEASTDLLIEHTNNLKRIGARKVVSFIK